ncbi:MAG: hypothetical protein FWD08_08180 [Alphaproteobacteria bacterium]|nr:hypothetical protein [Alphaproteobacteria bacterium]
MKTYLPIFDQAQTTRKEVMDKIDLMSAIENWNAFFDNTICRASARQARSLSGLLHVEVPTLRFIITEIINPRSKGGWLSKSIWAFLSNPQSADTAANA